MLTKEMVKKPLKEWWTEFLAAGTKTYICGMGGDTVSNYKTAGDAYKRFNRPSWRLKALIEFGLLDERGYDALIIDMLTTMPCRNGKLLHEQLLPQHLLNALQQVKVYLAGGAKVSVAKDVYDTYAKESNDMVVYGLAKTLWYLSTRAFEVDNTYTGLENVIGAAAIQNTLERLDAMFGENPFDENQAVVQK